MMTSVEKKFYNTKEDFYNALLYFTAESHLPLSH